jgi:hypothetical protein
MLMKRHVSAYLEAIFRFKNAGYIETNVGTFVSLTSIKFYLNYLCLTILLPTSLVHAQRGCLNSNSKLTTETQF